MRQNPDSTYVYVTSANQTPESIAFKLTGENHADLAEQIWRINKNSVARRVMHHRAFADERAILLPNPACPFNTHQERVIYELDWMMSGPRHIIHTMIKQKIDPMTVTHAFNLNQASNYLMSQNGFFAWLGTAIYEFADGMLGYKHHQTEYFHKAIIDVREALAQYIAKGPQAIKNEERLAYKKAYDRLQKIYQKELERYHFTREKLYTSAVKAYRHARREGVQIMNTHEAKRLTLVSDCLKWVGRGLVAFNVVKDVEAIKYAYHHHGDWIKMAIEDSLEVLAGVGIGVLIGSAFIGGGWVVVISAGSVEAVMNTLADEFIKKVGDKIDS